MNARSLWVAVVTVLLAASLASAQTVYTWTDGQGVVHFSDENPEGVQGVETLTLEAPVPLVSELEGQGEGEGEAGGEGESQMVVTPIGEASDAPPPGPAEVVFQGAELAVIGDTQRKVRGRLRNVGGRTARRIAVRVVVTDGDSGNLCMTTDFGAQPAELDAGADGTFEGELDTPCFYGNPKLAYYPEWD
jgi:hypothetical protein